MRVGLLLVRHDPASAAVVRSELAADLQARSLTQESVDDVLLVASELVGNAVVHGHAVANGALDVGWDVEDDVVIVRVNDDWGVHRAARGKQVWAPVPVTSAR